MPALCGAWEWLVISAVFGLRTHQLRLFFFLVLCACTHTSSSWGVLSFLRQLPWSL